ncbi:MAG TPA: hypothetical protein PLL01_09130 [Rhodoferax sp.]|jgi:hypothetical protein|nr:hypothetical protein [Rhodoferax sp.]
MTEQDAKNFANLQALFALRGHALNRVVAPDGSTSYFAVRWGMSRHMKDLDAVQAFLEQLGGIHAQ